MSFMWQINSDKDGIEHTVTYNDGPPPDGVHQLHPTNVDYTWQRIDIYYCADCKKFCFLEGDTQSARQIVYFIEPRFHESRATNHESL